MPRWTQEQIEAGTAKAKALAAEQDRPAKRFDTFKITARPVEVEGRFYPMYEHEDGRVYIASKTAVRADHVNLVPSEGKRAFDGGNPNLAYWWLELLAV